MRRTSLVVIAMMAVAIMGTLAATATAAHAARFRMTFGHSIAVGRVSFSPHKQTVRVTGTLKAFKTCFQVFGEGLNHDGQRVDSFQTPRACPGQKIPLEPVLLSKTKGGIASVRLVLERIEGGAAHPKSPELICTRARCVKHKR